jgi:hypothetical protein
MFDKQVQVRARTSCGCIPCPNGALHLVYPRPGIGGMLWTKIVSAKEFDGEFSYWREDYDRVIDVTVLNKVHRCSRMRPGERR